MSLQVLVTERLSPGLRGALSQWYVEINPGVFVGTVSARIRDQLWSQVEEWVTGDEIGYALAVYPATTEQGYELRSVGTSRYAVVDHHGLALISRQHDESQVSATGEEIDPGW
ncbi:type I-E CRISPR-associated endoribonuclease Cas2e [Arsenicicoccus dermatophilus]|uniref:type I-E CRISPR-associated endoribonuclease Cas2e n=1 Tax=Arsenicicoccus dermatophilus TaxID=1076331 RepID=UPI0039173D3D